jgi:hypothetical protein
MIKEKIEIQYYEPWMKDQVAEIFKKEYKTDVSEFKELMTRLYEHEFQSSKCILIVAKIKEKIIGFQTFLYWPYSFEEKTYKSFQSGNSIVDSNYRGHGIFSNLLKFSDQKEIIEKIDFKMGFPVEASFKSFLKNKWINLFDLIWYMKIVNPFGFLFTKNKLKIYLGTPEKAKPISPYEHLQESDLDGFYDFKLNLNKGKENYFSYTMELMDNRIVFDLKLQKRKKIINELIIGSIKYKKFNENDIRKTLEEFIKLVIKSRCITILSIAINEELEQEKMKNILLKMKFKKLNKKIHFIVKKSHPEVKLPEIQKWNIGRSDVDTW